MKEKLYTKVQAAAEIGISPQAFHYWCLVGHVPQPGVMDKGRCYYDEKQIKEIKLFWKRRKDWKER